MIVVMVMGMGMDGSTELPEYIHRPKIFMAACELCTASVASTLFPLVFVKYEYVNATEGK